MKNKGQFTYNELKTIYYALHDSMKIVATTPEFKDEDRRILIGDLRDVAHKVAKKMEAMEDAGSY
jgi:hypothetical protein